MPYRGRDDPAVWACTIARTTWPLQCQLAPWKSNEALFVFVVRGCETFWNLRRMKVQYGDSFLSQGRVYEWVERFQNVRQNVSDEHWRGRPVSMAVNNDEIAIEFNMSHSSEYIIAHYDLGYRKVCSRWVLRQLSDDHKRARQTICQEHLDCHAHGEEAFLHRTVKGDESWVYHYEPESKRQLMQWKHPSSPANKKFKTQASAAKVMLTIFWDVSGPYRCNSRKRVKLWLVLDTVTC
jgi:hypothetical protein